MKKYRNILAVTSVFTTSLFATQDFLLPEVVKQDTAFRPFAERAFDRSQQNLSCKGDVQPCISHESLNDTQRFLQIDFDAGLSQLHSSFGFVWTPQQKRFDNEALQNLFSPYHTKTAHHEKPLIFSANILYVGGMEMYENNGNYTHLEQAAALGHHLAQFEMFNIKYKESDYQQAMNYILSSAAQKNSDALVTLSDIYAGFWPLIEEKIDNVMAKLLCEEAAKQSEEAMFTLRVSTKTEGFFGEEKNFQAGIKAAKELAESGNNRAVTFLESLKRSSGENLSEMFDLTNEDLKFLETEIQWKDATDD